MYFSYVYSCVSSLIFVTVNMLLDQLFQDQDLNVGNSYHCETFDSPCLASSTDFVCMTCNVYSVEMS